MLEFTPVDRFHVKGRGDVYLVAFTEPVWRDYFSSWRGQEVNLIGFGRFKILSIESHCANVKHRNVGLLVGARIDGVEEEAWYKDLSLTKNTGYYYFES